MLRSNREHSQRALEVLRRSRCASTPKPCLSAFAHGCGRLGRQPRVDGEESRSQSHAYGDRRSCSFSLWEPDEKRKCSAELFRLDSLPIEVDTSSTIGDVRKNNRPEYMCDLPTIVVESRNTALLVITYHLVEPSLPFKRLPDASLDRRFWPVGLTRTILAAAAKHHQHSQG